MKENVKMSKRIKELMDEADANSEDAKKLNKKRNMSLLSEIITESPTGQDRHQMEMNRAIKSARKTASQSLDGIAKSGNFSRVVLELTKYGMSEQAAVVRSHYLHAVLGLKNLHATLENLENSIQ